MNDSQDPSKRPDQPLDHDYDGIKEYDNPLPAWWVNLFYITIVFGLIYMVYFTFFTSTAGERADEAVRRLKGEPAVQAVEAAPDDGGTETVPAPAAPKPLQFKEDADTREKGQKVFVAKCLVCHGAKGEGLIGPNLTDAYWLHGKGSLEDIHKVVVDGVPDKGMLAWKDQLSEEEILSVVVYVKSLQGTNPPNPKAPQGELAG